jgi:hypothetical protein
LVVKPHVFGDHPDRPPRQHCRVLGLSQLRQDQGELVTAQARHCVACANAGVEPLRDFFQEPISGGVAERVVDILEVVEIEQQERNSPVMAPGLG